MSLKVVFFEDDADLIEMFQSMSETGNLKMMACMNLEDAVWKDADIILGDYNNKIVSFNKLKSACENEGIPLIAISGGEMNFSPKLQKPFMIEELESLIMKTLNNYSGERKKKSGLMKDFVDFFKKDA